MAVLIALLIVLVITGCILAVMVGLGDALEPDPWRKHKRELNAAVVARRVRS